MQAETRVSKGVSGAVLTLYMINYKMIFDGMVLKEGTEKVHELPLELGTKIKLIKRNFLVEKTDDFEKGILIYLKDPKNVD